MNRLFNFRNMMLTSVVPYMIFAVYSIFKPWSFFPAASFIGLTLLSFIFYLVKLKKKENIEKKDFWVMAAFNFIVLLVFSLVFLMGYHLDYGLNYDDSILTFLGLASIPLVYNIMGIAYYTSLKEGGNVLKYAVGIFVTPFLWYYLIVFEIGMRFDSMVIIEFVFLVYFIIFMLCHIFFIALKRNKDTIIHLNVGKKYYIITFILGIFMPISGLIINEYMGYKGGLFGDYTSPIFFIIAIINGLLLMVPPLENNKLRLLLFYFRSVTYTYILYFCIVFIPVIPIGIIVLIMLIGIYAFAPLFITLWQGKILWNDWLALKQHYHKVLIIVVFVMGLLTIPTIVIGSVYNDRENIENAVAYIDGGANQVYEEVDLRALERSLDFMEVTYDTALGWDDFFSMGYTGGNIPIISNMYNKLFLKEMVLTVEDMDTLNAIFFDNDRDKDNVKDEDMDTNASEESTESDNEVILTDIVVETQYDEEMGAYRTWVDLELANYEEFTNEYITTFTLPEGVYVSDYYLYVGDEKKMGMLADERAATYLYDEIVSSAQDPGILHYIGENTLELKVFPFEPGEVRYTGFELIHKNSFTLEIDGQETQIIGDETFEPVVMGDITLLSGESTEELQAIERTPTYNFVIDCSLNSNIDYLKEEVLAYAQRNNIEDANVYFTSYKAEKTDLDNMESFQPENAGGYNLNLATKMILDETEPGHFPIIIAVSSNMPDAIMPLNTNARLFPESEYYYGLNYNFTLTPYAFADNEKQENIKEPILSEAVIYQDVPVLNNGQNQIVITDADEVEYGQNQFENAVLLRGENLKNAYNNDINSVETIKNSFRSNILTQTTAFIVVETEEQEKELLSLQEQLLSGNAPDVVAVQNLSEPPIYLFVAFGLVFIFARYGYKRITNKKGGSL